LSHTPQCCLRSIRNGSALSAKTPAYAQESSVSATLDGLSAAVNIYPQYYTVIRSIAALSATIAGPPYFAFPK
jgi:hypothetical protein